jgi:hypothetical protein
VDVVRKEDKALLGHKVHKVHKEDKVHKEPKVLKAL